MPVLQHLLYKHQKHLWQLHCIPGVFSVSGNGTCPPNPLCAQKIANCERKNELKIYLSDKEQYILEQKVKISGMKSKSTFLRRLILYGYVYDIDYSGLRDYNATPGKTSSNLNQIAKRMNATGNVYKTDVEEVKKLMKQVWDTQLAMLKKQPNMKQ